MVLRYSKLVNAKTAKSHAFRLLKTRVLHPLPAKKKKHGVKNTGGKRGRAQQKNMSFTMALHIVLVLKVADSTIGAWARHQFVTKDVQGPRVAMSYDELGWTLVDTSQVFRHRK